MNDQTIPTNILGVSLAKISNMLHAYRSKWENNWLHKDHFKRALANELSEHFIQETEDIDKLVDSLIQILATINIQQSNTHGECYYSVAFRNPNRHE